MPTQERWLHDGFPILGRLPVFLVRFHPIADNRFDILFFFGRFGTAGCGSAHGLILSPDVFRFNQRVPKRAPKCVLDSWGGVFCEIRDRGGSAVR